jgi:flavin reductase (DIM6/NTAB) family NADH-FMN oxidoreductase RutF
MLFKPLALRGAFFVFPNLKESGQPPYGMITDFTTLEPPAIYRLMTQIIIPRPIAWVLSDHGNGTWNLAPFSYFSAVSSQPPLLSLSVGSRKDGSPKDTWTNIEERSHFVLHIPQVKDVAKVLRSAESLAPGQSELETCDLEVVPFDGAPLPRLKGLPLALYCEKEVIHPMGLGKQALILGRILKLYVDQSLIQEPQNSSSMQLDPTLINPLARLGSDAFASINLLPKEDVVPFGA